MTYANTIIKLYSRDLSLSSHLFTDNADLVDQREQPRPEELVFADTILNIFGPEDVREILEELLRARELDLQEKDSQKLDLLELFSQFLNSQEIHSQDTDLQEIDSQAFDSYEPNLMDNVLPKFKRQSNNPIFKPPPTGQPRGLGYKLIALLDRNGLLG